MNDLKKKMWANIAKWGFGLALVGLLAPLIFTVVKGLLGLGIAIVLTLIGFYGLPLLIDWFTIGQIKLFRWSAYRNPVETLRKRAVTEERQAEAFCDAIDKFRQQVNVNEGKVRNFAAQYPDQADIFKTNLANMKTVLELREEKYKAVTKRLGEFNREIEKAQAIWDMAQASRHLAKAAGLLQADPMERIKTETAVYAIQDALSQSLTDMQIAMRDEEIDKMKGVNQAPQVLVSAPKATVLEAPGGSVALQSAANTVPVRAGRPF